MTQVTRITADSRKNTAFVPVHASLSDMAGREYIEAVCAARSALSGEPVEGSLALATEQVDFYPPAFHARLLGLLPRTGHQIVPPSVQSATGATTRRFASAARNDMAPIAGYGFFRVGESGTLFLTTKSEHYHTPLGHAFPGYRLLEHARRLGIPNATHNNTRGHITRLLEEELVRTANGIEPGDRDSLARVLASDDAHVLNRVLNLETGSLAVEAALKMILARFFRCDGDAPLPVHHGMTPVVLVMGDDDGNLPGNYHGTTVLTQVLRGMWPEFKGRLQETSTLEVRPIRPNSMEDIESAFRESHTGRRRIAGFFHEIVMMNYGGRLLTPQFLQHAYELCAKHDVPTVADEIQSCMWAPGLFLFREYGLRPTFVAIGKGFPGGEYPASRLLFSAAMDCLPQFGALVTNGQEEIASLAYLTTMRWALANSRQTHEIGDNYNSRLRELLAKFPESIRGVDGSRHMSTIRFGALEDARAFTARLAAMGLDISVQTYKSTCPPVVLTKLPLTADLEVVDFVVDRMAEAMTALRAAGTAPMACAAAGTTSNQESPL